MQTFIQSQQVVWNQNNQAIGDIRTQLTKLAIAMSGVQNEKGKFPTQPQSNPQGQHSVDTLPSDTHLKHLKSITALRSGK